MKPEFSVIIPSYNHEKYIGGAIESVINQTFEDWELIIIDDGSPDNSVEIIKQYKDPRIKLFTQENHGAPYTINRGMNEAQGKYIAILNSDDLFESNKLEECHRTLSEGYDFVFGKITVIDENNRKISDKNERVAWINRNLNNSQEVLAFNKLLLNINYLITTSNFAFKKEIVERIGNFNEKLHYGHDFDFLMRLHSSKIRINFIPSFLCRYRMHSDSTLAKGKAEAVIDACYVISKLLREKPSKKNKFPADFYKHPIYTVALFYMSDLSDDELEKLISKLPNEKKDQIKDIIMFYVKDSIRIEKIASDRTKEKKINADLSREIKRKESALRNARAELKKRIQELKFVKSSKFWKLRNIYIAIKNILMLGQLGKLAKTSALVIKRDGLAVFFRRLNIFYKERLIPKENVGKKIVGEKPQERWPDNLPLVSVVIPCFNYGSFVRGAMDSVLAQTFQNFEIIIIDDGSTDKETTFALKNINHPKAKVIFQENQGLAETRNRGAELAKGKYVCFLDADDMLEPAYLEKTLLLLEDDENLGCAYSWLQCFGDDDSIWHTQDLDPYKMRDANLAASHSVVRKSAWEKVRKANGKGFLSKYNGYFEDWVFWIDMVQAGYGGKVIKEPLIKYRIHKKSMSATHKSGYEKKLKELRKDRHKFFTGKSFAEKMSVTANSSIKITNPFENLSDESDYAYSEKSILFVVPWLICGGAETVLYEAIKGIRNDGFSVYIITTEVSNNEWKDKFSEITPYIYDLPASLSAENHFDFIINFLKTRKIRKLCGIHARFFYECLSRIRKQFPDLVISDILHNDLEQGYMMHSIKNDGFINKHIVISNRIKAKMIPGGVDENKIKVIYSGVDTDNGLKPDKSEQERNREIRLLFLGRLSEEKRPLDFLKIAEKFMHNDEFVFSMAGDGPLRGNVEEYIKNNAIKNVKLLGIATPREVLRENDIVLITSSIEGLPMSMMEAMSMENVVISTSVGEVGNAINDGETGYLIENIGDIGAFAEKIKFLSENREELKKMGKNSRKFAVEKYDVRRMQQEYVNLFNNT